MLIINPGTEPRPGTAENAQAVIVALQEDIRTNAVIHRAEHRDWNGYWSYRLEANGVSLDVSVPGVDPQVTFKSEPWESPRLYVDGSSWLYGYAVEMADGFFRDAEVRA